MKRDDIYEMIQTEERLKKHAGEDEIVLSHDLLSILEKRSEEVHAVEMKSGIPSLDEKIHSFLGGELVVISGPTKMGKTLLAQTLTRNFYNLHGSANLWFTYEVPPQQFLQQFGDQLIPFTLPKTLRDNSLSWIIERVHEAKLKYGISGVFIDNSQNVVNLTANNLSQVMGEFLKALKRIAMKFNVVVFLLHHMAKVKLDDGEKLESSLLRDSSMVAQTADTVIFVWRDKDYILNPNKSYLKVTENRRYGVMNLIVHLRKIGNFLEEENTRYGSK